MEKMELFKPKFSGQRFNDVTLPFEILEDIAAYQDLLLQVAKDIYYQKNNNKKVPNGFGSGVYLKLSGDFKEGSTITSIILAASTFLVGSLDTKNYFTEAQKKLTTTISLAERGKPLENQLSENAIKLFNKFGKHLKEDEAILFSPNSNVKAIFTPVNRRKIILSSPSFESVENDIDIRGTISGVDKYPPQFAILTKDRIKIFVPLDNRENLKIVEAAYNEFENEKRVLISATGVFNKQNKLSGIKNIKSIILLDKNDVPTQLEKFQTYKSGWMNGEGVAFNVEGLNWLSKQFDEYYSRELLLPITFPKLDGGIEFQWESNNHDITLDVDIVNKTGFLNYLNIDTNANIDMNLNLDKSEEWVQLNDFLKSYVKG